MYKVYYMYILKKYLTKIDPKHWHVELCGSPHLGWWVDGLGVWWSGKKKSSTFPPAHLKRSQQIWTNYEGVKVFCWVDWSWIDGYHAESTDLQNAQNWKSSPKSTKSLGFVSRSTNLEDFKRTTQSLRDQDTVPLAVNLQAFVRRL